MRRGPRNPWVVVAAATVAQIVGQGPILQFTFGVFLRPLIAEFGWTRGKASLALTTALALTALSVPFVGRLMDRFGIGRVGCIAVGCFALGLVALGAVARTPTTFVTLYALVGIAAAGQGPLPYTKAIAVNFEERRGLALGVALNGVGLGSILMPQLAQLLISRFGWRGAYIGIGVLLALVALPILGFIVSPSVAKSRLGNRMLHEQDGLTAAEAFRDRRLYILGFALFLAASAANGTIAHVVPLLTDKGTSAAVAVAALGLVGLASIVGRVAAGFALDKWESGPVAGFFLGLSALGVITLTTSVTLPLASSALIFIGLGLGAEANLVGFMVARYFGTRAYGQLFGCMFGTFLLASSIGPAVMGLSFDATGSYRPCLIAFAISLCISALLFQILRTPRPIDRALRMSVRKSDV